VEEMATTVMTKAVNDRCQLESSQTWWGQVEMATQGRAVSQVLTTMQQQGWRLYWPGASSQVDGSTSGSGACAVMVGKLSRHDTK
jgi:hypothetical protein